MVGSDRFSAYSWLPLDRRQVCWAHLLRDFQKLVERGSSYTQVEQPLRTLAEELLTLWTRVRDGTLAPETFLTQLPAFQHTIRHFLAEGMHTAHPKTAETCRRILQVEPALWAFATQPGVEPTNNAAERALRQAVIWRHTSYGTQSSASSRFVERILSVVETCRQQGRNPLDYLSPHSALDSPPLRCCLPATWSGSPPERIPISYAVLHGLVDTLCYAASNG